MVTVNPIPPPPLTLLRRAGGGGGYDEALLTQVPVAWGERRVSQGDQPGMELLCLSEVAGVGFQDQLIGAVNQHYHSNFLHVLSCTFPLSAAHMDGLYLPVLHS